MLPHTVQSVRDVAWCLRFVSVAVRKYSGNNNRRGKRFFGSYGQATAHQRWEVKVAVTRRSCARYIRSKD